ncbi:MAG: bifunctional pyr operon transcriptional regulator/uracil phosphoribosyltransferase PyrR [Spirochaetota bacterium]|nr:bifunctional pyr operon transcriptional regulator/uracil phosphoribosyltransferase PyrR [Spirochaetota bacterium]
MEDLNKSSKILMNETDIHHAILRICYEIIEKKRNLQDIVFVGIKTGGEYLAKRFQKEIEKITSIKGHFGTLDITLYRDDFDTLGDLTVGETNLMVDINKKRVILVDDVLYTGRTIRSALDELVDFGRPAEIELAVLIDRGGRELPICASYVGKTVSIKKSEYIKVQLKELNDKDQVISLKRDNTN